MTASAEMSHRRRGVYRALAAASALTVVLVGGRFVYSGEPVFGGLVWNLFLAWIPFGLSIFVYDRYRAGARLRSIAPAAALWLLFLPNAPYILTDFKHLVPSPAVPLWADIFVIATPAWTGLMLGLFSLYLMHAVAGQVVGHVGAWTAAVASLALSSFGIYLGRVLRWNSWDVFVQPHALLGDVWERVSDPAAHPRTVGMTLLLTAFLTSAYAVVYSFLRLARVEDD